MTSIGNYREAYHCLRAAMAIRADRGQEAEPDTKRVTAWHWSGAVIVLADAPTAAEERDATKTLESENLNWYEICKRSANVDDNIFAKVED
jgi:hypothetical protein